MSNPGNDMLHFDNQTENYYFPCEEEESRFGPERFDRHSVGMGVGGLITGNAARERTRVKTLRGAFLELQRTLPAVPPDTKLSKLDVLVLATTYIAHLMRTLNEDEDENQLFAAHGIMHPVKKWPMRSRLYAGILSSTYPVFKSTVNTEGNQEIPWQRKRHFVNNTNIQPKMPKCSRENYPEPNLFTTDCQNS